jgi:hypothetical protein
MQHTTSKYFIKESVNNIVHSHHPTRSIFYLLLLITIAIIIILLSCVFFEEIWRKQESGEDIINRYQGLRQNSKSFCLLVTFPTAIEIIEKDRRLFLQMRFDDIKKILNGMD